MNLKDKLIGRIGLFVGGLAVVAAGLAFLTAHDGAMGSFQMGLARITGGIINLFGAHVTVSGNTIQAATGFSLAVVTACTGVFTTGVFLVGVIAYPARWKAKLIGIGLGICGIFLVNLVRLTSLFYIGVHFPRFFNQAHLLVWQSLIIVFALFLWLAWAGRVAHAPRDET